jgi:hypothetical protein
MSEQPNPLRFEAAKLLVFSDTSEQLRPLPVGSDSVGQRLLNSIPSFEVGEFQASRSLRFC